MRKTIRKIMRKALALCGVVFLLLAVGGHIQAGAYAVQKDGNDGQAGLTGETEDSSPDVPDTEQEEGSVKAKQLASGLLSLTWEKQEEAGFYRIYREQGKNREEIKETEEISVKDALPEGVRVRYIVEGYGKGGKKISKASSSWVCVPKKAGAVHTTRQKATAVRLTFEAKGANGYSIYRKSGDKDYHLLGKTKNAEYLDSSIQANASYRYRVVPFYVNKREEKFKGEAAAVSFSGKASVDTSHQKYSYVEMQKDIRELKNRYYDYMNFESIGKSADGRELYAMEIGNPDAKRQLLVVSTLHAREYMSAQLCMKQAEYLLEHYNGKIAGKKVAKLLDHILIRYIPMANPDGVTISQKGPGAIRTADLKRKLTSMNGVKNYRRWKANARGVDLNRNWSWHHKKTGRASSEGYSGKKALSEKETKEIAGFLKKINTKEQKLVGIINYHTQGNIIFGSVNRGTDRKTAKITKGMYQAARRITGYASAASYQGSGIGNFREYHMMVLKIPGITVEVGRDTSPVPIRQFSGVWAKNKNLVIEEAAYLKDK